MLKYASPLALCMISTLTSLAQTDSIPADVINDTLVPVEIIGIRANDLSPFAIKDMQKYEYRKYQNGQDISYTLESLPSIVSNSDAGNGVGYTDIRVRGTDMQRINFTLNGIPLNDAESQSTFFVNMPDLLSSSHSIQIQRGVGSSTNGPGSFGASINLSNAQTIDEPFIETSHAFGSFRTFRNSLSLGTGKNTWGLYNMLRISHIKSDGYINRSNSELSSLHYLLGWDSQDQRTSIKFNALLGKEKTGQAWNGVSEEMLENDRRFNELGLKDDGTYYNDQTDNYQQRYFQLFLQHKFNEQWQSNIGLFYTRGLGYYNEYRLGESLVDYGLSPIIIDSTTIDETSLIRQLWLDNHFYGAVFNTHYQRNNTIIDIGGSITQFDNEHFGKVKWATMGIPADHEWYRNPANKFDANIYLKWTQSLNEHITSYADIQWRGVEYNIYGFRKTPEVIQENKYSFLNPKLGLTYNPNFRTKAYFSFGVAQKEPNRDDFEASIQETPQSEKLYDAELGYEYKDKKLNFSVQLYYMYYKNQLINTGKINDVGAYTRMNIDKSFRRGIELAINYKFNPTISLQGHSTFSQNKILNFTEYIDDYDNGNQLIISHGKTDISLSPSIISQLQLSIVPLRQFKNFQVDLTGRYISRQYLDNTSSVEKSLNPYFTLNSIMQYTHSTKNNNTITFGLTIQNILNHQYSSKGYTYSYISEGLQTYNYYFPQAGRQYYLTINTRL